MLFEVSVVFSIGDSLTNVEYSKISSPTHIYGEEKRLYDDT